MKKSHIFTERLKNPKNERNLFEILKCSQLKRTKLELKKTIAWVLQLYLLVL